MVRDKTTIRSPGRILRDDFLPRLPPDLQDQSVLADRLGMSRPRLNEILNGRRPVTLDSALRLARLFGTAPELWLRAQMEWELEQARRSKGLQSALGRIEPLPLSAEPGPQPEEGGPEAGGNALAGEALTLHLAAAVDSLQARAAAPDAARLPYYREFLERRGLLREADRYVRIRAELDQIEHRRRRTLPLRLQFPAFPPGRRDP